MKSDPITPIANARPARGRFWKNRNMVAPIPAESVNPGVGSAGPVNCDALTEHGGTCPLELFLNRVKAVLALPPGEGRANVTDGEEVLLQGSASTGRSATEDSVNNPCALSVRSAQKDPGEERSDHAHRQRQARQREILEEQEHQRANTGRKCEHEDGHHPARRPVGSRHPMGQNPRRAGGEACPSAGALR